MLYHLLSFLTQSSPFFIYLKNVFIDIYLNVNFAPCSLFSPLMFSLRFGRFMGGEDHVTDVESFNHDSTCEINPLDLDDSDSSQSELSLRVNTR